tara:strand:+ start:704 stop:1036 length:333 start_codon:yes stop_codon:yes gene_type:complete
MSKFFDSEIIREELREINELQETVYGSLFSFAGMSREDRIEHIDLLVDLLERQKIMYTRLSLSDDPDAKRMKEELKKSITLMGFPDGTDMQFLFNAMHKTIQSLRLAIDQ